MRTILKSDFLWQFLGGFALGAIGLAGLHIAESSAAPTQAESSAPPTGAESSAAPTGATATAPVSAH